MSISDAQGNPLYKVHSPTCCMGMCVDICAEGNPCFGKGCCKVPFYIYPATQEDTDNGAPYIGKVVKVSILDVRLDIDLTDEKFFVNLHLTNVCAVNDYFISGSKKHGG